MPAHPWYLRERKKLSKQLLAQVSERPDDEPLPLLVVLAEGVPHDDQEIRRRLRELGGRVIRDLPLLGGFAAVLPGRALAEIATDKKIKQVHLDRRAHTCLDVAIPSVEATRAQESGYTGRGVAIAIVDSGIQPHPDFTRPSSRIVAWYDAVNGRARPYDDHGHGTHVAGIAAGNGFSSNGKYRGVAPEADIVAVKVADADGSASMSQIIEGLQWVLANRAKFNIRVVNLSLGSDPSEAWRNDPLCQAVERLWRAGLVVVVAAGNDGPAPGSVDTPGLDPLVITVGAVDDSGTTGRQDDRVPDFSSRGPTPDGVRKPEIYAPGVAIMAPKAGGGYIERTGTSMATPFVSGAAALLLAKEPRLQPDQVKARLSASSGLHRTAGNGRVSTVSGYLNIPRLLGLPASPAAAVVRPRMPAAAGSIMRSLFSAIFAFLI